MVPERTLGERNNGGCGMARVGWSVLGGVINGGGMGLCNLGVWFPFPQLPLTNCVILGKTFNLLEYQFPHL